MHSFHRILGIAAVVAVSACGPRAHIPRLPIEPIPGTETHGADSALVRSLSPVLYLQRDETFPLSRVVAVVHPFEQMIAYHLLWRDDAHGAWLPFTIPTDEEIVWVGYDSAGQATHVWTYWHGVILNTDWRGKGRVAINVQWGKHGSMPRGMVESDLPWELNLPSYFVYAWLGIPDLLLGRIVRKGPSCFCHGYRRYRQFTRVLDTSDRLDVIARTDDPDELLGRVFGRPYSRKPAWPPLSTRRPSDGR